MLFGFFQLIGCLVVFFFSLDGLLGQENKEVQRWHEQTWNLGIGWYPLLVSEKSCKFL